MNLNRQNAKKMTTLCTVFILKDLTTHFVRVQPQR
jgi:hypothetical protein